MTGATRIDSRLRLRHISLRMRFGGLLFAALAFTAPAHAQALSYLGQQIVPSGTLFGGTPVGGLSGIDRNPSTGAYIAISDDRSNAGPARYYGLTLDLGQFSRSATPGAGGVGFTSVTTIQTPAGAAFAANTVDPESIRFNPASGNLLWSNEGQRGGAGVPALQNPTVREMTPAGAYLRDFAVPAYYNPGSIDGSAPGIRNNLAFESLTVSTDGRTLYTATENALVQDGPAAAVGVRSPSRILSFDLSTGAAGAQFVYEVEAVALPPNPAGGFATNGLVELMAVADGQFIAVERSFAAGAATPGTGPFGATGNTIRLYAVDARGATDVSGFESLSGVAYTAMQKNLLLDMSDLRNDDGSVLALDNIEGISLGPVLGGQQTLILVSDNNFGSTQFTQFVALSIASPVPEPGTVMSMLGGLVLLGSVARLRRR